MVVVPSSVVTIIVTVLAPNGTEIDWEVVATELMVTSETELVFETETTKEVILVVTDNEYATIDERKMEIILSL